MSEYSTEPTERVLRHVLVERLRQDAQWGGSPHDDQHSPFEWVCWITKHLGKVVSAADAKPVRSPPKGYRESLLAVAALAVAAIEAHDRAQQRADAEAAARVRCAP